MIWSNEIVQITNKLRKLELAEISGMIKFHLDWSFTIQTFGIIKIVNKGQRADWKSNKGKDGLG